MFTIFCLVFVNKGLYGSYNFKMLLLPNFMINMLGMEEYSLLIDLAICPEKLKNKNGTSNFLLTKAHLGLKMERRFSS